MTKKRKLIAKPGPGYDGKVEHGTLIVVDPYDGKKLNAQGNVKHDILVHLYSRGQINQAQFAAGCRLQSIWYRAQAGNVGTCIPVNTRVDTSVVRDPIPLSMVQAQAELAEIAALLGQHNYDLARRVVCEGVAIVDLAEDRSDREGSGWLVRRILTDLAKHWGMSLDNKRPVPIQTTEPMRPFCEFRKEA